MLRIVVRDGKTAFHPGERVEGEVSWELDRDPRSVELSLFWATSGQVNTDVGEPVVQAFGNPLLVDRRAFSFTMPAEPYSFEGRFVTLAWVLELVATPGKRVERLELVMSPTTRAVELYPSAGPRA